MSEMRRLLELLRLEASGAAKVYGHDCGEDCCVCLDPEENERCDICGGKGGWWRCYTCTPETEDELQ